MKRYTPFLALLLIPLAWLLFARDSGESSAGGGACLAGGEPGRPAVVALLGDESVGRRKVVGPRVVRLLRVSLPDGAVEAERELGPRFRNASSLGSAALAKAPDGKTVVALAGHRAGERQTVEVVDAATLKTRCRFTLARGVRYGGVTVGRSGRIYAYGFRENRRASTRKFASGAAVVTILDAAGGVLIDNHTVRRPRRGRGHGRDWWPHSAAVSGDERTLVLTYHGNTTTGADWVDLSGNGIRRCASRNPLRACVFQIHGNVEPFGDGFLATTGSRIIQVTRGGRVVRRLPVKTRRDHLMDFALDADQLYVSRCGKRPVIRRVDLTGDRFEDLPSGRVCGTALAVGGGVLVLSGAPVDKQGHNSGLSHLRLVDLEHPGAGVRIRRPGSSLDAVVVGQP